MQTIFFFQNPMTDSSLTIASWEGSPNSMWQMFTECSVSLISIFFCSAKCGHQKRVRSWPPFFVLSTASWQNYHQSHSSYTCMQKQSETCKVNIWLGKGVKIGIMVNVSSHTTNDYEVH